MSNEDIAKELLEVLMEKMWFREGLPSEGWAIEKICDALVAAQQLLAPDACPECGEEYSGACGSCAVGHERG